MPRAYSLDLRTRVMHALDAGLSPCEIERSFGISVRTIVRWDACRLAGRDLRPATPPGRPPKLGPSLCEAIVQQVHAAPDLTLADYVRWLEASRGVTVSVATMSRTLHRQHLTRKKRP